MTTTNENASEKYWIALGMIQPEWIYMSHFLDNEEEVIEESSLASPTEMRITFRSRIE